MSGWIKLHRKINDNPILKKGRIYSNFEAFIFLLLRSNYESAKVVIGGNIYKLKQGQMIISKKKLMKAFNWGNSRLNTFLNLLQKDNMIEVKTNSQMTMITILNWDSYQETKSQSNINQTSTKLQPNTNKNNKKNIKKNKEQDFINQVLAEGLKMTPSVAPDIIDEFCNYWTERSMSGRKMKYEMSKTFDIKRRLTTWIKNKKDWDFKSKEDNIVKIKNDLREQRYQEQLKKQKEIDANAPTDQDFVEIKNILNKNRRKE